MSFWCLGSFCFYWFVVLYFYDVIRLMKYFIFLWLLRCNLWTKMWFISEKVLQTSERNVYSQLSHGIFCSCLLNAFDPWSALTLKFVDFFSIEGMVYLGSIIAEHRLEQESESWELTFQTTNRKRREHTQNGMWLLKPQSNLPARPHLLSVPKEYQLGSKYLNAWEYGDIPFKPLHSTHRLS